MAETADTQRLVALIEANTKSFERALNRLEGVTKRSMGNVQREVSKIDAALKSAGAAVTSFVRGFAVGAIAAGVTGLAAMAKNAISTAAALNDVAQNTGIAASELQKLAFAAEQSGGSAESLLNSFKKFNVEIGEARIKGNDLAKILEANGVSLEQDNLTIWRQIVDLIANAKDETDAAYLAQLAMGRSASDNLEFFRQGTDQMARLGQEAEEAGIIIDDELVQRADEFADRWSKAMAVLKGQTASWILSFIDALDKFDEYWKKTAIGQISPSGRPPDWAAAAGMGGIGRVNANLLQGKAPKPLVLDLSKPKKDLEEIPLKVEEVNVNLEKTKTLTEHITDNFSNLGSTLLGVARGTETLAKAMQRMLDSLLDRLADQAFQQLIAAMLGALGGKTLGTSTFTSGAQARQALSFGGPRQGGGHVTSGKSYLVGERGPELMVPNRSGYVVPSGRGGGGTMNVQIVTPPGMQAETRTQRSGNGQSLQVTFRQMLAQELPGVMKPMLRDQYAMTPATRRRF